MRSTVCSSCDARVTSAWRNPEWVRGQCAHTADPCTTLACVVRTTAGEGLNLFLPFPTSAPDGDGLGAGTALRKTALLSRSSALTAGLRSPGPKN